MRCIPFLLMSIPLLAAGPPAGQGGPSRRPQVERPRGPEDPALRREVDAFAREALRRLGTSAGLSVAAVKDGRVVYTGCFGLRDVEARLPVTPDTRFRLASSTKAFTAMAAAILACRGALDLDAPLSGLLPELKLTPPLDPARLSLRDLLAMRSGLANSTVNFRLEVGNLRDRAELLRLLATYSSPAPRVFRYSNLDYILAGEALGRATGRPWSAWVQEDILGPLGMDETCIGPAAPEGWPVAKGYRAAAPGRFEAVPMPLTPLAGPAGTMLSTPRDLAFWLRALLGGGRYQGRQVLPARAVRLVASEQTTDRARFRDIERFAWGLGQDLGTYDGELLVHRFGGMGGAYAHVSYMPERGIGVVALSNGGGEVPDAVAGYLYDRLLGRSGARAKGAAALDRLAASASSAAPPPAPQAETARPLPAHPDEAYEGTYHSDRLGDIQVSRTGGVLKARLGVYEASLIPDGGDAFHAPWVPGHLNAALVFRFPEGRTRPAASLDWGGRLFERAP